MAASAVHRFRLTLPAPPHDWRMLLYGHGWIFLAPHVIDPRREVILQRPLALRSGLRTELVVSGGPKILVQGKAERRLTAAERREVAGRCRWMLRLDEDLADFHRECRRDPLLKFAARRRSGRMLRSPTVWEDLVKTLCTTNCSWANTKGMVARLCATTDRDFPTPAEVAGLGVARLRSEIRAGYRAEFLHTLATRVVAGELDPEGWAETADTEETVAAIRSIHGAGDYAVRHMLTLLGRYDAIPLDSEVRGWIRQAHFGDRPVSDAKLLARYERFGAWKFLAYKLERIARRENVID